MLNSSLFIAIPVFSENQAERDIESAGKNIVGVREVQATIDQSIYGNLLKNPTLQVTGTELTDWTIRPGGKDWMAITSEIGILTVKNAGFKVIFSDKKYNQKPMYLNYESNNLIKLQYKNFAVSGVLATLAFQQEVQTIGNRTYTAEIRVSEKSDNPYVGVNFHNQIGYEGNEPYYRTKDIKNRQTSQIVTYYIADNNGDPVYLVRDSLLVKMKYASQWKAVDALFTSLSHTELAQGVTIRDIDKAEIKVECLSENKDIKEMTEALNKARDLFEKKVIGAVNGLVSNGQIVSGTTQESFDHVQSLINYLPEGDTKKALTIQLNKVKDLWGIQKQAQAAIENLFKDEQIKSTVSQEELNQAQQLLDKLSVSNQFLQKQLDKAKDLWEKQKNVQTAVEKLFQNGQVKPNISNDEINQVQQLINNLLEGDVKQKLQTKLDKAQKMYNQKALVELTITINDLFTDTTYSALNDGVTSDNLDKIIIRLEKLPEGDNKERLVYRIALAQAILNIHKSNMNIQDQVDRLFADTTYTQLAAGVTYDTVKGVNESVIKLTDVTLRNKLKKLIETAQELMNESG